jgi:hypothetical protein
MIYQRSGVKRTIDDADKKRQAILERAGWKRVVDKATEKATKEVAPPLSMVEPVPQDDPVSLVEVEPEPAKDEPTEKVAKHARPAKQ